MDLFSLSFLLVLYKQFSDKQLGGLDINIQITLKYTINTYFQSDGNSHTFPGMCSEVRLCEITAAHSSSPGLSYLSTCRTEADTESY